MLKEQIPNLALNELKDVAFKKKIERKSKNEVVYVVKRKNYRFMVSKILNFGRDSIGSYIQIAYIYREREERKRHRDL